MEKYADLRNFMKLINYTLGSDLRLKYWLLNSIHQNDVYIFGAKLEFGTK